MKELNTEEVKVVSGGMIGYPPSSVGVMMDSDGRSCTDPRGSGITILGYPVLIGTPPYNPYNPYNHPDFI